MKKPSPFTRETSIDIAPYLYSQEATTSIDSQLHGNDNATAYTSHRQERTESDSKVPTPMSWERLENQLRFDRSVVPEHVDEQVKFSVRLLSTCKKIKPILLVLLSTILATPLLVGIGWSKSSGDSASSSVYQRYEKFSQDMLQLQKQYIHQSAWLWHGLRITAWQALTEPLNTMPIALLMVIPHGHEQVGFCIATKSIDSFNKIHDQKTTKYVTCRNISQERDRNETAAYAKEISLAIRTARQTYQSAVLIDHLEKQSNATLPLLDKFLDPVDNLAENKMLIFTFYVPSAQCNPDFVRNFLIEAWISQVFAQPTLARKLIDNAVFITPYDASVKCK